MFFQPDRLNKIWWFVAQVEPRSRRVFEGANVENEMENLHFNYEIELPRDVINRQTILEAPTSIDVENINSNSQDDEIIFESESDDENHLRGDELQDVVTDEIDSCNSE